MQVDYLWNEKETSQYYNYFGSYSATISLYKFWDYELYRHIYSCRQ